MTDEDKKDKQWREFDVSDDMLHKYITEKDMLMLICLSLQSLLDVRPDSSLLMEYVVSAKHKTYLSHEEWTDIAYY